MNISFIKNIQNTSWMILPQLATSMLPALRGVLMGMEFKDSDPEPNFYLSTNPKVSTRLKDPAAEGDYIFVTHISGVMMKHDGDCGMKGMRTIAAELNAADKIKNIIGSIVIIESGGGASNSVPELADVLSSYSRKKPVVGFIDGMACSAAIYAASYMDKIIAYRASDIVGSVGTFASIDDFPAIAKRPDGSMSLRVYADGCEDKNAWYEEALKGNFKIVKEELLNPHFEKFKQDISSNRPAITKEYMTGKTYNAGDVVGIFVDAIGDFQSAVDQVIELSEKCKQESNINNKYNQNTMPNLDNLHSIAGLEELECDAEGSVTLTAEQLQLVEDALAAGTMAVAQSAELETAQGRINELETTISERDKTISTHEATIAELRESLEKAASSGGAAPTTSLNHKQKDTQDIADDPSAICRAHIKKYE